MKISRWEMLLRLGRQQSSGLALKGSSVGLCSWWWKEWMGFALTSAREYFLRRQVMREVRISSSTKEVKRMMKVPQYEVWMQTQQLIFREIFWVLSLRGREELNTLSQDLLFGCFQGQTFRNLSSSPQLWIFSPITIFLKVSSSLRFTLIQCVAKFAQLLSSSTNLAVSNIEGTVLRVPSALSVSMQKRLSLWAELSSMQILNVSLQQLIWSGWKQKQLQLVVKDEVKGVWVISVAGSWQDSPMQDWGHKQREGGRGEQVPPLRQ